MLLFVLPAQLHHLPARAQAVTLCINQGFTDFKSFKGTDALSIAYTFFPHTFVILAELNNGDQFYWQ